jgi:DNA-3-methyladenine glycosylase I
MSYCTAIRAGLDEWNKHYHDTEYGFPLTDDNELFERLILEINQAGLSWLTILKKRESFKKAYHNFSLPDVAAYTDADRARLLADAGIIRNRLKVNAAIENARRILELGSFAGWLNGHQPQDLAAWNKLFKKTFVFTGGEIVREFLVSTGYLPGAHDEDCPIYKRVAKKRPPWMAHSARPGK